MIKEISRTTEIALRTFETDVELRSFVIRFQNVAKRLNKIPYFVISKNMKQLEMIKCEICSDSEAVCFLDNVNEVGELCDECFYEVAL